ncbi:SRSF5 factor, partial [Polyodon spathula]|nr:SRSF5 factor [Polyodon spathula]
MSGCRVFIGRLSPHARERDVEKFFRGFGHIREINLKNGFGFVEFDDHRDADDAVYELNGKELCNERVTIEHARSPRGRGGGGAGGGGGGRYGPPVRTEHRIIVENLSSRISWQLVPIMIACSATWTVQLIRHHGEQSQYIFFQTCVRPKGSPIHATSLDTPKHTCRTDLKDMMRKVGEVTFVDAHRSNKNEGVVEFASHSDMKNAIDKLDGTELNGRKLKLTEDRKKK